MAAKPNSPKKLKLTDKAQSERFKNFAREVAADESGDTFDRVIKQLLPPKKRSKGAAK
jgi:hypothetical protein